MRKSCSNDREDDLWVDLFFPSHTLATCYFLCWKEKKIQRFNLIFDEVLGYEYSYLIISGLEIIEIVIFQFIFDDRHKDQSVIGVIQN